MSLPECGSDNASCGTIYWYVYLTVNGDQTQYREFKFKSLNIYGEVTATSQNANTGGQVLSTVNKDLSLYCSPPEINQMNAGTTGDPTVSFEEKTRKFSLIAFKDDQSVTTWSVTGRKLLFVIAVNAFPGETIEPLGNAFFTLELTNGSLLSCTTSFVICNNSSGTIAKTVANPPVCSPQGAAPELRLGPAIHAPTLAYGNRVRVPVWVRSGTGTPASILINSLDFLLKLNALKEMAGVSLESGKLKVGNEATLTKASVPTTATDLRIYANKKKFSVIANTSATDDNTLFYIVLDGPALASECTDVTIDFFRAPQGLERRMNTDLPSDCCAPWIDPSGLTVSFGPSPCLASCADMLKVEAKKLQALPTGADGCSDVFFDLFASSQQERTYNVASITVDVLFSGAMNYYAPLSTLSAGFSVSTALLQLPGTNPSTLGRLRVSLEYSGIGFITNPTPLLFARLAFRSGIKDACIHQVVFYDALFREKPFLTTTEYCIPQVLTEIKEPVDDDICVNSLFMRYAMWDGKVVKGINYEITTGMGSCQTGFIAEDSKGVCPCNVTTEQTVTPVKDENPLSGVSTYDLVLISKHILGLENLNSPFQLMAADGNRSNTVTTTDIVELRKLILGIYYQMGEICPQCQSFRFVEANHIFSTPPSNPLIPAPNGNIKFSSPPGAHATFKAVKIGDVNNSYTSFVGEAEDRSALLLGIAAKAAKTGEQLELPVFVQQATDFVAFQTALRYDPARLSIQGVRWAKAISPDPFHWAAWHSPTPGELRIVWFDAEGKLAQLPPGSPLFFVQAEALAPLVSTTDVPLLQITEDNIKSEAYAANGARSALRMTVVNDYQARAEWVATSTQLPDWMVSVYPNPAHSAFKITITAPAEGAATLTVFDALGCATAQQSIALRAGSNTLTSAQLPTLPAGQYMLRFDTPFGRQTLRLVKQD